MRHHVTRVWVCAQRRWWRPSVVHVRPWWARWVGLHQGWGPPLHHVGAWSMALPVAGCALVAVRGGVITITVLVLVVTPTTPVPAGTTPKHTHCQHLTGAIHRNKARHTSIPPHDHQ